MAAKLSYLRRSPSGFYSYRRRVPDHLKTILGKTEWKEAFNTKDERLAHRLWLETNEKFDDSCRLAELALQSKLKTQNDVIAFAKSSARRFGYSPDLRPTPPTERTPSQWDAYEVKLSEWNQHVALIEELLLDQLDDETVDYEQMQKDYASGKWAQANYTVPRKQSDNEALIEASLQIASGKIKVSLEPTLEEARLAYLRVSQQDKERSPRKQAKHENDVNRVVGVIAAAFSGPATKLKDLDRQEVRRITWSAWPNVSTRNRYLNTLSALINSWNTENNTDVFNPFKGLTNKEAERRRSAERLPFKPHQWHAYLEALETNPNEQVRLIGLIMAYTGCRTEEASGLEVRDVKVEAEVPHIVFRDNMLRHLDKGGLERAVPIVPQLLSKLRNYHSPTDGPSPYFPRYGHDNGAPTVSALLSRLIRLKMQIIDRRIVPYSTRHTLHDMMDAAGVPVREQHYLVGHKSNQSTSIHDDYGTKMPPKFLVDSLTRAFAMKEWGYFED